jgi:DNA-binding LacI/PurR family transcriptional regulator
VPSELLNSLCAALDARNLHLAFARLPDEKLTDQEAMPKILRQWMVDGLLIDYIVHVPERMIVLLHQYSIPAIWLNTKFANDCVYPDDFAAGRFATEYLVKMGHRRSGYALYVQTSHYSAADRYGGYAAALQAAGLTPQKVGPESATNFTEMVKGSCQWLSSPQRPSAVVVYSGRDAMAIVRAAEQLDIRIPQDLSIVTFGDYSFEDYQVTLATMVLPQHRIAEIAIDQLVQKIEGPPRVFSSVAVSFDWNEGTSCAPPLERT